MIEPRTSHQHRAHFPRNNRLLAIWTAALLVCGAALGQQAEQSEAENSVAENSGEPTAQEVADQLRAKLATFDHLDVVSNQSVSFVRHDLSGKEDETAPEKSALAAITGADAAKTVRVKICSSMTKGAFKAKIWKVGMPQPVTEFSLAAVDGVAMMTERQWYPSRNEYREETYPSARPEGINSLAIESCLFDELPSKVCATAEFFQTWIGASYQADLFQEIVAKSTVVEQSTFEGSPALRLKRPGYETENDEIYRSRNDTFWVSPDTHMLLGWRIELVDIAFGKYAAYQLEENAYEYRPCETDPAEPASEGGVSPPAPSSNEE